VQTEKIAKRDRKSYCCSNPTCKSVFSRPKIIKYYACPTCHTKVEMVDIENQTKIEQPIFKEKSIKLETLKPRYIQTKEVETTRHISKTKSTKIKPKNSFIPEITVPNECVECPKNLDCMLSKVHQSTKSVKEIKKWYHFR